jgi:hypothetical protein
MLWKSALATVLSGSIGGMTASRSKGGAYFRARVIPVDPASTFQVACRAQLTLLSGRWSNVLTQANRDAWNLYAQYCPYVNNLGDTHYLTGQNMFIACNTVRVQAGLSIINAGPVIFTAAALTPVGFTAAVSGQLVGFTYTNTDQWATEVGGACILLSSRPHSAARTHVKGGYRYAGKVPGAVVPPTSPVTLASPFAFVATNKVFMVARSCLADGRISPPFCGVAIGA